MPSMSENGPALWTPLPQSSQSPRDRYKHACCSCDGHVYMLGGRDGSCSRDFWRYSVGKTCTHKDYTTERRKKKDLNNLTNNIAMMMFF